MLILLDFCQDLHSFNVPFPPRLSSIALLCLYILFELLAPVAEISHFNEIDCFIVLVFGFCITSLPNVFDLQVLQSLFVTIVGTELLFNF